MSSKVFYSWQSDLPSATNRTFIEDALKKSVKVIHNDDSIEVEPVIDRDTQGVGGSPDIVNTILSKIDQASVFVCDVSIINSQTTGVRLTPNPNVLLELGYALKTLTPHRVIMVFNTAFGQTRDLPFDLGLKRVLSYEMKKETSDRATERNGLSKKLEDGLRIIFEELKVIKPEELEDAQASIFTEEDCLLLLEDWLMRKSGSGRILERFGDVDKLANVSPGSAKRYLKTAAERLGMGVDAVAENVIRIDYQSYE